MGIILEIFIFLTGYNRAYASYVLNKHGKSINTHKALAIVVDAKMKAKRHKKSLYKIVKKPLIKIWQILGYSCGKRLKPILIEVDIHLKTFGKIRLDKDTGDKLSKISVLTIDRLFKEEKKKYKLKGKSHTKLDILLKIHIPLRTFEGWNEQRPFFLEMDLVGHEGGNPKRKFIQSLWALDIYTEWKEIDAVRNKTQKRIFEAIEYIANSLTFPLSGIDSDKGAEFINAHLYMYGLSKKITFTMSRKYRKK